VTFMTILKKVKCITCIQLKCVIQFQLRTALTEDTKDASHLQISDCNYINEFTVEYSDIPRI
jgi:hypothetical protein